MVRHRRISQRNAQKSGLWPGGSSETHSKLRYLYYWRWWWGCPRLCIGRACPALSSTNHQTWTLLCRWTPSRLPKLPKEMWNCRHTPLTYRCPANDRTNRPSWRNPEYWWWPHRLYLLDENSAVSRTTIVRRWQAIHYRIKKCDIQPLFHLLLPCWHMPAQVMSWVMIWCSYSFCVLILYFPFWVHTHINCHKFTHYSFNNLLQYC